MIILFCPHCSVYFPAGLTCPVCQHPRAPVATPPAPNASLWTAQLPGGAAARLTWAQVVGRAAVIAPWAFVPPRGDDRPPDGGVTALALDDGSVLWVQRLGLPVEGGVALCGDALIVGVGARGIGAGQGALVALNLVDGAERWRAPLGGAVLAAPVVAEARVYAAASDGTLACLDARNGQSVWRSSVTEPGTLITAAPVLLQERGLVSAIIVATHGRQFGRQPGRVVALDAHGRDVWSCEIEGNMRGTPALASGRLYVPTYAERPARGALLALDARTGKEVWRFAVQHYLSAALLAQGGRVYVGSLDHHLYALDAATGKLVWQYDAGKGVAGEPLWLQGLVLCGANDGAIHAVDAETGVVAWTFPLGGRCLTASLPIPGGAVVANDAGDVAALPWHLGHYDWAAERLESAGRWDEAGDAYALAAHFAPGLAAREAHYQQAVAAWEKTRALTKAAMLWAALDRREQAAAAFRQAGEAARVSDRPRAAACFARAAALYAAVWDADALNACTRAQCTCAGLPYLEIQPVGVPGFRQWEPGTFTLRLRNTGAAVATAITLSLGGAVGELQPYPLTGMIESGAVMNIPMQATPSMTESELVIELDYDSGLPDCGRLRALLRLPIHAEPRPQPQVQIGDIGVLRLPAAEGIVIQVGDVGLLKT